MNGYTSVNAAITVNGHKRSLAAVSPEGVFVDLEVLARAPRRLIQAGFGDAICRSTAQADWLLAGRLLGQPYRTVSFSFTADLESQMRALHDEWEGLAAQAHAEAHAQWTAGMVAMRQAMSDLRAAARAAHGNYTAAGDANVAMWRSLQ